ncbi:protein kinase domain-containing protein [Staphylococcus delphini]|uniref:protein kinase domain-containing protein n=1 Tax=Staphylococcus delphini TaxID=53344 RepID=UPI0023B237D8|nr:hypothetical protein [Staphylococcus delphini]MDE9752630.1 hypothetical protein [Staphylococcus delphini]MDE9790020.1 hypothetical protein [Staphylococcus delphini]MDE9791680.1 hypothetical protein [Staphylococcus delphini]MDE9794530.1 hypothetical protein [Staphylococcus delphini]MDE9796851.1 hypothetical protein [Staphylococcus delphini]
MQVYQLSMNEDRTIYSHVEAANVSQCINICTLEDNEIVKVNVEEVVFLEWLSKNLLLIQTKHNLLTYYDVFYIDKSLFIVEEFIEGETLTDIFLNGDLQVKGSALLLGILEYLNIIHLHGYIINDLSPDNIVIDKSGNVRFIDAEYTVSERKYTEIMNLVGTPGFSKLEYSLKDKDLYFFICICYFFFNRKHYEDFRNERRRFF